MNILKQVFKKFSTKGSSGLILFSIFAFALFLRFLYFPENVYFGFDQARDAYESINIYKNFDLKIVGPPTAMPNFFHGPLYWYLVGPLYILANGNPNLPAAFMIIYNALGVFLIYWIGKNLFNNKVGLLAAFIYAISFEQTQYAAYFHHPPLAMLTIMLFYGGLAIAIFKNDVRGVPLAMLGYGLSIQSEFQLPYLVAPLLVLVFIFREKVLSMLNLKVVALSALAFLLPMSTYVLAELKYGWKTFKGIVGLLTTVSGGDKNFNYAIGTYLKRLVLQIQDNIFYFDKIAPFLLIAILALGVYYISTKKNNFQKLLFLYIWFLSIGILTIIGPIPLYYTFVGISPAIILIVSFFILEWSRRTILFGLIFVFAMSVSNISKIVKQNPDGVISDIQVQEGMLLLRELQSIDHIYSEARGKPIVVSALTMPLKVNTTWAYLFNWYGKDRYGYLPYWAGEVASGYPGNLPKWESQEDDYAFFSIIEPTRGIRDAFVENFLNEQKQYGEVQETISYGDKSHSRLQIQMRK